MTQPRRMLWFAVFAVAVLLLPAEATAQNYVTPIVTPPRPAHCREQQPGANHTDPHVDGDLVCYTYQPSGQASASHYFNLAAGTDNVVPPIFGVLDFLCDVRGTTITRDGAEADILSFETASSTLPEIDPR